MKPLALVALLACTACQHTPPPSPQAVFFARLSQLCGQKFEGRLASTPTPADAAFAGVLTLEVGGCTSDQVRMPLAVGADRSRTWVVTRGTQGLTLKHDHRHADGTEDDLSQYGGTAVTEGQAGRQDFPADAFSRALFARRNATVSIPNVWSLDIEPDARLGYELNRPGRHVRLEFDLTHPVPRKGQ